MLTRKLILTFAAAAFLASAVFIFTKIRPLALDAKAHLTKNPPDYPTLKAQANTFLLAGPELTERDRELAVLGRKLFFDKRFSRDGSVACATCHQPERSFTDGLPLARGVQLTGRNAPTIINAFALYWFFWDGRADSLAAQALGPLENDKEHGITRGDVVRLIATHYLSDYEKLFGPLPPQALKGITVALSPVAPAVAISDKVIETALVSLGNPASIRRLSNEAGRLGIDLKEVFKKEIGLGAEAGINPEQSAYQKLDRKSRQRLNSIFFNAGLALEAYEKGIVANESAFDHFAHSWVKSDNPDPAPFLTNAFGMEELLGFSLFVSKGSCHVCHNGGTFSDSQFHNIGLPEHNSELSLGRSLGIQQTLSDEFNCHGRYARDLAGRESQSCLDLKYLDPDTPEAIGSFKTPTLRNVGATAPYMHDGRFATLRDVIKHYNAMDSLPALGFKEETLFPLGLTEMEIKALEAFLRSLTSPVRDKTRQK